MCQDKMDDLPVVGPSRLRRSCDVTTSSSRHETCSPNIPSCSHRVRSRHLVSSTAASVTVRCLFWLVVAASTFDLSEQNVQSTSTSSSDQPRIVTQSGHLIFQTAENHNITFRSSGTGSVLIDGQDLKQLIAEVKESRRQIDELKASTATFEQRLAGIERQIEDGLKNLSLVDVVALQNRVVSLEGDSGGRRIGQRVGRLEDRLKQLNDTLNIDSCSGSTPCRNGGTCVNKFRGYTCLCPAGWQGPTCSSDVNECSTLVGTDRGCQNGGTCVNTIGSYRCNCPANFYGQLCTEAHDDCTAASNEALCAHGTCQNVARTLPGQPRYRCNCDVGWKTDGVRPACDVDVDECTSTTGRPPCSVDPLVQCINTPGSFTCAACPPGFSGNGFICTDIDECSVQNGGCSTAPLVACTNTPGSRMCGPCPPGYDGNGILCSFVGVCGVNNGGCNRRATCNEVPGIVGRSCTCPSGYSGNGVGWDGCQIEGGPCASNPCGSNGVCQATGRYTSYICVCNSGWTGVQCTQPSNPCASNPCMNGGTCTSASNGSFVCTCAGSYTGPTCSATPRGCGGVTEPGAGTITFPPANTLQPYPHSVNCFWSLSTQPNKILSIRFTRFKLELSPDCRSDFVLIMDGSSLASTRRVLGRFCGTYDNLPNGGAVNTSHSTAVVMFHSDASVAMDGFTLVYSTVDPVCGGRFIGSTHGTIQSPGFPGSYPNSRDCYYYVQVNSGSTIQFTFGLLEIEAGGANCTKDYLQIWDGPMNTRSLALLCGTRSVSPMTTNGPTAAILFHSDAAGNANGFTMSFTAQNAPGCGAAPYTNDNGVLMSPNYPNPYAPNLECYWTIRSPNYTTILFTMVDIDTERHAACNWDYVEIRKVNDDGESTVFLTKYCGNSSYPPYPTAANVLSVKFRSDTSNSGRGFRATWKFVCEQIFQDVAGNITSPWFPARYPNNADCFYYIQRPPGNVISLTFLTIDIEPGMSSSQTSQICVKDYLEVLDGGTDQSPQLGKFCGVSLPYAIQSNSSTVRLRFKSDAYITGYGFRLQYRSGPPGQSLPPSPGVLPPPTGGCGGLLSGPRGNISSPRQPLNYPNGANCTWYITAPPGHVIRLTFGMFSVERHVNCSMDYVEIFDSNTFSASLGRYCGIRPPPTVTSSGNSLTVLFVSDRSVTSEGFMASYVALNASTVCGDHYTTPTGDITSPGYPSNYPNGRECEWTIVMPAGRQILLNVTDFMLENDPTCAADYLEIRDGGFSTSPFIGKYCGTSINGIIASTGNRLYFKLVTNSAISMRGFRMHYDGTLTGCGGQLTGFAGSFSSPNHPLPYGPNVECFWNITVAVGSRVRVTFIDFQMESHASCNFDYVELRDNGPRGNQLAKICGNGTETVQSTGNTMWIKMRTDSSTHGRGFFATYTTNCNVTLSEFTGVIESPNFPYPYPNGIRCTWYIQASMGNTVNASFSLFQLQPPASLGQPCTADYVEMLDSGALRTPTVRFCGNILPPPVATRGQYLLVRFASDDHQPFHGFRLEYVNSGCGGILEDESGVITSPNYPGPYPASTECVWTVKLTPGKRINLTIDDMQMETHTNCLYDFVEVYGGPDRTSPVVIKLCHTQTTAQTTTIPGNAMIVRFRSDVSNSGRGFSLRYDSQDGGCGGEYSARTGTIMSENYPSNYSPNSTCIWHITVEPRHRVELQFLDFDVERSRGRCDYDYVAVYDSDAINSTEIGRYCGDTLPPNVTSSGNEMWIRMQTDRAIAKKGFKAQYRTGCGGLIAVDEDDELSSPGWPHNYNGMSNCSWTLRSVDPDDKITLIFTHMDIDAATSPSPSSSITVSGSPFGSRTCPNDYVRVANGDDADAPLIGVYCGSSLPAAITSSGSALFVQFVSDMYGQRTGFRATYSRSLTACGGPAVAVSGRFNSPRYPEAYPPNAECVWTIVASPGNRIMLTFSSFNLESNDDCSNDYVEVLDGVSNARLAGPFCGEQPTIPSIVGSNLLVKFVSDENTTAAGFVAQYETVWGGELVGNSGSVSSPLYPNQYPHNVDVSWTIVADLGLSIVATFATLDVERSASGTCSYDHIKLYDGNSRNARLLGTFCGMIPPNPIRTEGNVLFIEFHTDLSGSGRGFLINWATESAANQSPTTAISYPAGVTPSGSPRECRFVLTALINEQWITTPGYPQAYANNLDCEWRIRPLPFHHLMVTFTNMSLEENPTCSADYVRVLELGFSGPRYPGVSLMESANPSYNSFCGSSVPTNSITTAMNNGAVVAFHSDASDNYRGFNLTYKSVCGGRVFGRAVFHGLFMERDTPLAYEISNCTWFLDVRPGRTIRLMFDHVDLESEDGRCTGDYVEVFNGEDVDSPLLGQICGNSSVENYTVPAIQSTDNHLTVRYVSDGRAPAGGVSFLYREMRTGCGGQIDLTDTDRLGPINLTSPEYPAIYDHNAECIWYLRAPVGRRVRLRFADLFGLEPDPSCRYDAVELFDGADSNAPLIRKYCGHNKPTNVPLSSGNALTIRFRTDGSAAYLGFAALADFAMCGGGVEAANGTITSPHYPSPYENDTDCEWFVQGLIGHYVTFHFEDFRLDLTASENTNQTDTETCDNYDFVELRDFNATGELIGKYCGVSGPTEGFVDSSDSAVYVRFHSNSVGQDAGFRIRFVSSIEACGGQMSTPTGVLTSPNYPGFYAHHRLCRWVIRVQLGRKVTLTFNDVSLEEMVSGQMRRGRCGDYIKVINGDLPQSPALMDRICWTAPLTSLESSANTMVVVFKTDGYQSGRGFKATYTSENPADCGGALNLDSPDRYIESPGYSNNGSYNNSVQCVWTVSSRSENTSLVSGSAGSSLVIKFLDLDLEKHGSCEYDYVELREGTDETGQLLGHFCNQDNSTDNLPLVVTPLSSVWIRFVADSSRAGRGFRLQYYDNVCGGELTNLRGTISSPQPSSGAKDCVWLISAPEGALITLLLSRMLLTQHVSSRSCNASYVEILNGGLSTSPVLSRLCSPTSQVIVSSSNRMRIVFHTNSSLSVDQGFRINYLVRLQACGGSLQFPDGVVTTPNYPLNFGARTECVWEVTVPVGYHIEVAFNGTIDVPSTGDCSSAYVELVDPLAGIFTRLWKGCGSMTPPNVVTSSNRLRIKFRSSAPTTGTGFSLNYTSVCGATLKALNGTIMSPGYPGYYPGGLNCTYNIEGDLQKYTMLRFLPGRFMIRNVHRPNNVGPFNKPSNGPPRRHEDHVYHVYPGMQSCVGDYLELTGLSPNPTGPFMPPMRFDYEFRNPWDVMPYRPSVPEPVVLDNTTYYQFPLGNVGTGRFCGTIAPLPMTSLGPVRIRFVTEEGSSDRGWVAEYQVTECGGRLTRPTGTIQSLLYPDKYPDNINCTWIITVPGGKLVKIKFENFTLEGSSRCEYDYVAVYDGPVVNSSMLIGRFCGRSIPPPVVSNDSTVTVVFITDSSHTYGGFLAVYSSVYGAKHGCGGQKAITSTPQTIGSPDISGNGRYDNNMECEWHLISMPNETIVVDFTTFRFEDWIGSACVDFIEIREGLLPDDPLSGPYCGSMARFNFTSSTNLLSIRMRTDSSDVFQGFVAQVYSVPRVCGGNIDVTTTTASITIEDLSILYRGQQKILCRWHLTAPPMRQVELNVTSVAIGSPCSQNYLEITDSVHRNPNHDLVVCSGDNLPTHISAGHVYRVDLVLNSVSSPVGGRLQLKFNIASCNRHHDALTGRIVSPQWPSTYPHNALCVIRITAPQGYRISLFFSMISIESHSQCQFDYLEVLDESASRSIAKLCGNLIPDPIFLTSNSAMLKFVTDSSAAHRGYDLTYISTNQVCGGELTAINGTFTSPEYPDVYSSAVTCRWTITTLASRRIQIQLSLSPAIENGTVAMDFAEENGGCNSSYVIVYDDSNPDAGSGRYCVAENIAPYTSSGTRLVVEYRTQDVGPKVPFRADYWSLAIGNIVTVGREVVPAARPITPPEDEESLYDEVGYDDDD